MLRARCGFTLVELLIVVALLGVVMTAVLSLVRTTQRHVYTSDEVVEVQQNLRVALDFMSRDLRLAGFGIADDAAMISAPAQLACADNNSDGDCLDAGEAQFFSFRTLCATGQIARMGGSSEIITVFDPASDQSIPLASSDMARLFAVGHSLRIFRPASRVQPLERVFRVTGADDASPSVTLRGFNAPTVLRPGDLLLRVLDANLDGDNDPNTNPPAHPNTVSYRLVKSDSEDAAQFYLARIPTGVDPNDEDAFEILATKIVGVQFGYLLQDGSETSTPGASDLDEIRAVRITLVGASDATRTGSANYLGPGQADNVKTRSMTTIVHLRNR